ncbi:MAG: 3-deoxy-manno-octulosonate cytidylyltransferase [Vicinamibacterales bacterium]
MPAVPVRRLPFAPTETSVLAIIPARYHSTRFPGKALADLDGRSMIEHVYRRATSAQLVHHTIIATDDERIVEAVTQFGGDVVRTRDDHCSATDRVAEVVSALPCRVIVNVQGDEPLIEPAAIDAAVRPLIEDSSLEMTTLSRPATAADMASPHVVKVVCNRRGRAMYFSRAPIPWDRDGQGVAGIARAHVGLYAYRRDVLLRMAQLPPAVLEQIERLEQLRALDAGIDIAVIDTDHDSPGVDTPADLAFVRQRLLADAARR